jgi:hypothetical protein
MKNEKDLTLGETQLCLVCDNVKLLEQGEAVVRFGAYIEYTCYQCKERKETNNKREELHLAMLEDFSNVIAKHLPNFDNNIKEETWNLLPLFLDEIIHQLTAKETN